MTPKERAAMQQALEALESCEETNWSMTFDSNLVPEAITDLREALAKQAEQEPIRLQCTTCGTFYANGVPPQVKQAKREPVGVVAPDNGISWRIGQEPLPPRTRLYAAPVRTKDLTAQEKANIIYAADHRNPMAMIDAAIAADRELNK